MIHYEIEESEKGNWLVVEVLDHPWKAKQIALVDERVDAECIRKLLNVHIGYKPEERLSMTWTRKRRENLQKWAFEATLHGASEQVKSYLAGLPAAQVQEIVDACQSLLEQAERERRNE